MIGILTFNRAINYGALLQAYALKEKLKEFEPNAEIINYKCSYIENAYKPFNNGLLKGLLRKMMFSNRNKKFKKFIASYWGGDVENKSKFVVGLRKKCFKFADVITVTTEKTYEDFKNIYGDEFDSKLKICRFVTAGVEQVYEIMQNGNIESCKKALNIPVNKFCITIGYSAYAEQHQDLAIKKIATLPKNIKDKLFLSVPMQYGRYDQEYIQQVKIEASNSGCEYKILEEYVDFKTKAMEAIATDLYLNLRDTDAFSNTLKEQLCAGTTVVIGSWLTYYEIEKMKANVIWINSFDEITNIISNLVNNCNVKQVFMQIYDMFSLNSVRNQWKKIIDLALGEVAK